MKKFFMMALASVMMLTSANAQIATENTKTLDNIFVSVQGGATTPLDFNSVFPLNGTAGIKVGKLVTPIFGYNVEGNVWFGSNHFSASQTAVRATNVGLNGTIDLTNWIGGYNPNRVLSVVPEVGLGWLHNYGSYVGKKQNELTAKTGVLLNIKLNDALSVYAEPEVFWVLNRNGGIQFNKHNAQLGIQVGVSYRFKNSNGTRKFVEYDIDRYNNEINSLRADLAKKPTEVVKEVVKEVDNVQYVDNTTVILFEQNSAELSPEAKFALTNLAKNTKSVETIYGFASPEGDDKYNDNLSENRAAAVANFLKNEGVTVNSVKGFGSTGSTSNRIVIVTIK